MILRRITEHVKAQNWFAVGLDFLIVVIGVFMGIQVSNWNDAQADKWLEQEYLERLYADMVAGIDAYQIDASWDEYRLESQALVLNALRAGELAEEDREDFTRGLIFIGVHNPIRRQWGTVEELKSTGNIAILRDLELRNLIAITDASYERNAGIIAQREAQIIGLRERLLNYVEPLEYGFSNVDPAVADFDFAALAADQEFIRLFANANLESQMIVAFSDGYAAELERLRDQLADILGIDQDDTNE